MPQLSLANYYTMGNPEWKTLEIVIKNMDYGLWKNLTMFWWNFNDFNTHWKTFDSSSYLRKLARTTKILQNFWLT